MKHVTIVPSLMMAGGILASTAVAVAAAEAGWLVLGAPIVMSATMLAAVAITRRRNRNSRESFGLALILGAVLVVATALLAFAGTKSVAAMMPILAASLAYPVISSMSDHRQADGRCASGA